MSIEEQEESLPLCLHASSDPINFAIVTTVAQPDKMPEAYCLGKIVRDGLADHLGRLPISPCRRSA